MCVAGNLQGERGVLPIDDTNGVITRPQPVDTQHDVEAIGDDDKTQADADEEAPKNHGGRASLRFVSFHLGPRRKTFTRVFYTSMSGQNTAPRFSAPCEFLELEPLSLSYPGPIVRIGRTL